MSSEIRVGDAERDRAAAALGEHYAAGRLDHEEYSERLDAAWSARTRADLDLLFHDLPPLAAPAPPATRRGRRFPLPVAALLVLLVAAFVITHLPVVLLVLGIVVLVKLAGRGGHRRPGARIPGYGPVRRS
jgi:hypothetical protein